MAPPSASSPAPSPRTESRSSKEGSHAVDLILLALRLLSTRTVALAASLLPVVGLSMAFALAWQIMPDPTPMRLGALGIFSGFFLLLLLVRK